MTTNDKNNKTSPVSPIVFTDMPLIVPNLPEETLKTLENLKQFCSFDYIMII